MAEAIRRECDPLIFSLGFRNPRRTDRDRWSESRRNTYLRWRGTSFDVIEIQWDMHNWAMFFLNFQTHRVERPPRDGLGAARVRQFGAMRPYRIPFNSGAAWFGPWTRLSRLTSLVNERILELNDYLENGVVGPYVMLADPVLLDPANWDDRRGEDRKIWGDPWLDPESDFPEGPNAHRDRG